MGLFGNKPPCAICGGKVAAFFTCKVAGQMVCDECYGIVDLSKEVMEHITLEEFKEYMAFRKENELLKQKFQTTQLIDFGWLDDKFAFDAENRLLCMDKKIRKPVFEGRHMKSFEIKEDQLPLFNGSAEGLVRYTSTVPERVTAMAPQIEQLRTQIQMREEVERLIELKREETGQTEYHSLPDINVPVPFKKFIVEIHFEHPYWPLLKIERQAPQFSSTEPSIDDYLRSYEGSVQLLEQLAKALMEVGFPGAPERTVAPSVVAANSRGVSAPGVAVDALGEIERLKDLMDRGILTEEEFTAKKRQLLGISL